MVSPVGIEPTNRGRDIEGGRASFADAAAQDVGFWQQLPGGERLDAVFALSMEWYGPARAEPFRWTPSICWRRSPTLRFKRASGLGRSDHSLVVVEVAD